MTMEAKIRPWLLWTLIGVVLIGGGFTYWYISGGKSGATTTTSPTPTKSVVISPSAGAPTSGKTSTPATTQTPTKTSFTYNPTDSMWPKSITISFDGLGKTFQDYRLSDGTNVVVTFGSDTEYSSGANAITRAEGDASTNQKNQNISSYETPTATTVDGMEAAQYRWTSNTGSGISIIVNVYPEGQKALKITGFLNNISEADFNKIIQSIDIEK